MALSGSQENYMSSKLDKVNMPIISYTLIIIDDVTNYFSVPYHKPKQYSLKEFLSRRTIVQSVKLPVINKAAAAIKMSTDELASYA